MSMRRPLPPDAPHAAADEWILAAAAAGGSVVVGALLGVGVGRVAFPAAKPSYHRLADKFARSLMEFARGVHARPFAPRPPAPGTVPFSLTQKRAVILKGPHQTTQGLLAHAIRYEWYPWWWRLVCGSPRGLFLQGDQVSPTAVDWSRSQLDIDANKSPIATLLDAIQARESQQRVRGLLFRTFPRSLPRALHPQGLKLELERSTQIRSRPSRSLYHLTFVWHVAMIISF